MVLSFESIIYGSKVIVIEKDVNVEGWVGVSVGEAGTRGDGRDLKKKNL